MGHRTLSGKPKAIVMIYTIRTFQVDREHYGEFVRLSEEVIWPALEDRDGRALGLWVVAIGGPERIVLVTRYNSLAHWQDTRGWGGGSGLPRVAAEHSRLTRDTDLRALRPLSRRQPTHDTPEADPGIYTLRTFQVEPAHLDRFVALTEDSIWPWYETGMGVRPIGLWLSIIAPETRLYMMIRYRDLAHWEATRDAGPEPADAAQRASWQQGKAALHERRDLVQHTSVKILRPISRRQP